MTARNISTRYLTIIVNVAIGLVMLRFNMQHLGQETYGLWMLAASVATYFTVLDFGYGSAVVRYVAEYRSHASPRALNEVLSTMAYVFGAIGALCYVAALVMAALLPVIFNLAPGQEQTGRIVLLLVSLQVALFFPFSIYGGVINGFERYHLNNVVGLVFNVLTAVVNVAVLSLGYGLVELVAATTTMRIIPLWVYRRNAYRVFPALDIRREYFRRDRLRQLSGFSAYAAIFEWSGRLMYAPGLFFLGMFLNTAAVFLYAVAQRIADAMQTLTEQLHTLMMPAVVQRAADDTTDRLRTLLVRATRLQLATAMCLAGSVSAAAPALIHAWLGPEADASVRVTQILGLVVVLRSIAAMPATVLQGTGAQRYVAWAATSGAAVNVLAGVPLVLLWGVPGVAIAIVSAAGLSAVLLFPRACRAVQMSLWQGCERILAPTLWPALVVVPIIWIAQGALPAGLLPVLIVLASGLVLYVVLFVGFAIDGDERRWLLDAARALVPAPPQLPPQAAPDGLPDLGDHVRLVHRVKRASLTSLKHLRVSGRVGRSAWRRRRLLILCYHGVSLTDEHEWAPGLYVSPAHLDARLALLRDCTVLPLADALHRLYTDTLPERAVALTFDDGYYDFQARAWPLLRRHGLPVTVYLTTERVDRRLPIVNLVLSYAFWRRRDRSFDARGLFGLRDRFPLSTPRQRTAALQRVTAAFEARRPAGVRRDDMVRIVVRRLGLDYEALLESRHLTLLRPEEVARLSGDGVDVQMHTHLHRTPPDADEFVQSVLTNRARIEAMTGTTPTHLCYPSGNYRPVYLPALRRVGIESATTCDPGLAASACHPLLLPRFIDTMSVPPVVFEAWLTGLADRLPRRTRRGGDLPHHDEAPQAPAVVSGGAG